MDRIWQSAGCTGRRQKACLMSILANKVPGPKVMDDMADGCVHSDVAQAAQVFRDPIINTVSCRMTPNLLMWISGMVDEWAGHTILGYFIC